MKNQYSLVLIALFISVFLPLGANAQEVPLTVNCSASPDAVYDGETVTWDADASGGDENYTYEWTINDESVSTDESFYTSYDAESGDETYSVEATVTVTDGLGATESAYCDVTVIAPLAFSSCGPDDFAQITGNPVTWSANTTGGLGPNTYDWTGTDGLSGDEGEVEITYETAGNKTASINTISSDDGQTIVGPFSCDSIDIYTEPGTLTASCSVSPTSIDRNDSADWSANISGGNEPYTISWSGTDGLSGNTESIEKTYSTTGSKSASLTVFSDDGQSVTNISCSNTLTVTGNSSGGSSNNNDDDDDDSTSTTTDTNSTSTDNTDDESETDQLSLVDSNSQSAGNFGLDSDNDVITGASTTASTTDGSSGTTTDDNVLNALQAAAILAFLGSHPLGSILGALLLLIISAIIFLLRKKNNTV